MTTHMKVPATALPGTELTTIVVVPVIGADTVAGLLGFKGKHRAETFRAKRRTLEAAGFPPKLPNLNGWSLRAVMRWIDRQAEPEEAGSIATLNSLEARYGQ